MIEGLEISDLRGATVHSKQISVAAGLKISQHLHAFDHVHIVAAGVIELIENGTERRFITGPNHLIIKAGVLHEMRAITDAVLYCVHSAGSADVLLNDFEG
jgi:quercetin dioxygenase-like cupin family protein